MTNDQMRASDADRDRAAARLRDHFAEGRLTREELDERLSEALNAKTLGDLRRVSADLPESAPAPWGPPRQAAQGWPYPPVIFRRGPRILPLLALIFLAVLLLHGPGGLILGFFQFLLVFWLVTCVAGLVLARRFRRGGPRGPWSGSGYGRYRGPGRRL